MRDLERSARFWLRAYPPYWRAQRAGEVTAVLRDLAGDDARRLDARTAMGLLRGGIATRWRGTPPLRVYLPYRLLNVRVPPEYREWVYRDLTSPGYRRRDLLWRSWMFAAPLYSVVVSPDRGSLAGLWAGLGVAVLATVLLVRWVPARRRQLVHHVRPRAGERRAAGPLSWVASPRTRMAAEPAARAWVVVLAVGAAAWSTAAVIAPARLVALPCVEPGAQGCVELGTAARTGSLVVPVMLLVAAVAGVLLAIVVARRLRRRHPLLPEQPARILVGLRPTAAVGIALWCALIVVAALAEATGAWVHSLSVIAGPACLVVLPSAVAAWSNARATPTLAIVDLWHVARSRRPITVDRSELVPVTTPEVR